MDQTLRFAKSIKIGYAAFALLLTLTFTTHAQTVFWSDNFDPGTANNNNQGMGWTVAGPMDYDDGLLFTNKWVIGSANGACVSGKKLYVSATGGNNYLSDNNSEIYAISPNINTVGYAGLTLNFTWRCDGLSGGGTDYGQVGFSPDGGTTWAWQPKQYQGQGSCTAETISIPNTYEGKTNFEIGFRFFSHATSCATCDPPFNVDNITITCTTCPNASNTITSGTITGSPICLNGNTNISVPYTTTGSFNAGNIFTAQLSDAAGSFASPTAIGTGASPINATIPGNTPSGTHYRIRVVSSAPATTGTDNGTDIVINTPVTPTVTISASSNPVCSGTPVTFTVTGSTNGGSNPTYQWQVNSANVSGQTNSTYTTSALNNNDTVRVVFTSNAPCVTAGSVNSSGVIITITSSAPVTVSVTASPDTTICSGTPVTFNAAAGNGGSSPVYAWKVNNADVGTNSSAYGPVTLNDGDKVTVTLTSNSTCVAGNATVTSAPLTIHVVAAGQTGSVTSSQDTICQGTPFTLTVANITTGSIQWQADTSGTFTDVPGATSATYMVLNARKTTNYRVVSGSGSCAATSNVATVIVKPSPTASFTFTHAAGRTIDFTSTSIGATTFDWNFDDNTAHNYTPNPSHTFPAGKDTFNVCLTVFNGSNCSYTTCLNVLPGSTAITTPLIKEAVTIYPVPFTDRLFVNIGGRLTAEKVEIFDVLGRLTYNAPVTKQTNMVQINTSAFGKGIYLVRVKAGDDYYTQRVIKQ